MHTPSYEDILQAASQLKEVAHRTPVLSSRTLNQQLGAEVFLNVRIFSGSGHLSSGAVITL